MLRLSSSKASRPQGQTVRSISLSIPVGGLNRLTPPVGLPLTDAYTLDNFTLTSNSLLQRPGTSYHITSDFANNVLRLHNYAALGGTQELWATTDAGVFNVTATGAAPAATIALTNGQTVGSILSTGANNYLTLVNGTDSMVQYTGAGWAAVATVGGGAINTNTFSYIETYRQRYYFIVKNTTNIVYLNANSPTGGGTVYSLAAVFRKGGYLVALGTWTIDGGTGPDDHLVLVTSEGEAAVFTGNDPATWTYKGTYYISPPYGLNPFVKFGGDLLYLCADGVYPLSKALLVATLDRSSSISNKINPLLTGTGSNTSPRWQMLLDTTIPALMINTPSGWPYLMNTQLGAWFSYSSPQWQAECLAIMSRTVYMGVGKRVVKYGGFSDEKDIGNVAITSTYATGYSSFGSPQPFRLVEAQPVIKNVSYSGAPPPGSISAGLITVVRTVAPLTVEGTSSVPLIGGSIPARVSTRLYSLSDDYSPWKQVQIVFTPLFNGMAYYGMKLNYQTGTRFSNAGRVDAINV